MGMKRKCYRNLYVSGEGMYGVEIFMFKNINLSGFSVLFQSYCILFYFINMNYSLFFMLIELGI